MSRLSEERGVAGIALVLVIAWALTAVFMLTNTLVSAQQIDHRVGVIVHEVSPIDNDLDAVKLAAETNRVAGEIRTAAQPLSGQLAQVVDAAGGIDRSVVSILDSAEGINGTVKEINGTAKEINGTAGSINGTVKGIYGNAASINDTVKSINGNGGQILEVVRSIKGGVVAINQRADAIIGLVKAIKADTANILAQVGPGHGSPSNASIHGHANSIDCSNLTGVPGVQTVPRGTHCDR
jgi:methyl-accepting chemotaxis protein